MRNSVKRQKAMSKKLKSYEQKVSSGFTLIELLVVIAIIGLLATVVLVSLNTARANAKNSRQKLDLVQMGKALELYFSEFDAYPSTGGVWRGDAANYGGFGYGATGYIAGLVPQFTAQLGINVSKDRVVQCASADDSGYLYRSDGGDYKLLAHCTPEGTIGSGDQFYDQVRPTWAWQISTTGGRGW